MAKRQKLSENEKAARAAAKAAAAERTALKKRVAEHKRKIALIHHECCAWSGPLSLDMAWDPCTCPENWPRTKSGKVYVPKVKGAPKAAPKVPNPCLDAPRLPVEVATNHYALRMDFAPSNAQLTRYCEFHKYKMVMNWETESGYPAPTFDETALSKLMESYPRDPLFPLIQRYRQIEKCKGTYVDGIYINEASRVCGEFLHTPRTGRLCVAAGTPIEIVRDVAAFPSGIPIEDVEVGSWAYSYDADRKLVLSRVLGKWKTGHKSVIRVHWQGDGHQHVGYVDVTPEHPVRLVSGEYVEAQSLQVGQRVLSLSRNITHYGYARMWATGHEEIKREHRFVWEQLVGGTMPEHVHHRNHNKLDNRLENLEGIGSAEHHSKYGPEHWTEARREWRSRTNRTRWSEGPVRRNVPGKTPAWLGITKEWMLNVLYEHGGDATVFTSLYGIERKYVKKHLDKKKIRLTDIRQECASTKNHRITGIEVLSGSVDVYDLEIEHTHNFIAGEICVHNSMKGAPHQLQPRTSDPLNPFYRVREMYIAAAGHRLMELDFGGIEAVLTMYLAGVHDDGTAKVGCEDARLGLRLTGIDIHGYLSSYDIGQPADPNWSDADLRDYLAAFRKENRQWRTKSGLMRLYEDIRDCNKTGLYGSLYGGGPGTLVRSRPEIFPNDIVAGAVQGLIFDLFPSVRTWWWEVCMEADQKGYVRTPDGYRQYFNDVLVREFSKSENRWKTKMSRLANECIAAKPQHLAMCYTAQGLDLFWERHRDLAEGLRLTIHDSVVGEWHEDVIRDVYAALKGCMETPLPFLPLPAEWGMGSHLKVAVDGKWSAVGGNWREMSKIKL